VPHRRRRQPFEASGMDNEQLDEVIDRHRPLEPEARLPPSEDGDTTGGEDDGRRHRRRGGQRAFRHWGAAELPEPLTRSDG